MNRAVLLYRGTCRRCRVLSRIAVLASGGSLRRVALDADEARVISERYPSTRGKLALIDGPYVASGFRVIPGAARCTLVHAARWFIGRAHGPRRAS